MDDNKEKRTENGGKQSISNTGVIVIICLFLLLLMGISMLRNHNKRMMQEVGNKWLKEHPESIEKYTYSEMANEYASPDGLFYFKYNNDWDLSVENDDPLTVRLYNAKLACAMLIMKSGTNGLNDYENIALLEKSMSVQKGYKKDSGPIDCTINKIPGIRNNYHYYIGDEVSYVSNVHINVDNNRIVFVEIGCSTKDIKNNFKAIEQSFVFNVDDGSLLNKRFNEDGIKKLHKIYDVLSEYYILDQTFDEFEEAMKKRSSRRKAYDLISVVYDMAQSFEEFDEILVNDLRTETFSLY